MRDIVIVASNSILRHPRIWKIASSLKKRYNTMAIGWNREGVSSTETYNYITDLSLLEVKAPFGTPSLIFYYPIFWTWVFVSLIRHRPKIVHAIDLDTLLPCSLYKILFRKKLVYDVHDRFGGYVPPESTKLYSAVNLFEELLSKQANVLVTVSEKVQSTFRLKPKHRVIIANFSEDYKFEKVKSKDGILTLVYTGLIRKDQGLETITMAIKDLNGVRLLLAGRIADQGVLDKMLELGHVRYMGILKRNESLELEASSDVMIVLYDLRYRKNQLSSPNKIFEAMMCGIPLITNMEQELVSKEVGCGIVVNFEKLDQIKKAIILLRDDEELRKKMGDNGRKAFEEKYNWDKMEQRLFKIYEELLSYQD